MAWRGLGNVNSLLKQLQDIEESLTNLMMETILKMQTLTETKVFLLLENPATKSRRYCGDKELIAGYEKSDFKPSSSSPDCEDEAEVRLDPDVDILVQRSSGRKRRSDASGDEHASPSKRVTRDGSEGDADDVIADGAGDEDGELKIKVKSELCSDDEDYGQTAAGEDVYVGRSSGVSQDEEVIDGDGDDERDADYVPWTSGKVSSRSAGQEPTRSQSLSEMSHVAKIKQLRGLPDPLMVFQKGSFENKLLSNVMYQFGKQLGMKCPYHDPEHHIKEVRDYLKNHMHKFIQNFPRIVKLKKKDLPEGSAKKQGPTWYMKSMIRTGFRTYAPQFFKCYKKNAKKSAAALDE